MAPASVRVLGELSVDGLDVHARLDRKARQLLRLLAFARGHAVSTDALVDALWRDEPPARPGDQVSVLVSRVRRVLGRDSVKYEDQRYRLHDVSLDLDELATLVAESERRWSASQTTGAAAAARIALSLVRGPLPAPVADIDWAVADHAAAVRLVRRARRVAAAALLDAGAWADALEIAAADHEDDPFDETAVRVVMRAHVLAGRPALALAAYADLQTVLAEELGADPATETQDLHTAVLRGDVSRAATPTTPVLVGRTSQRAHLDALVRRMNEERMRVAVITGEAGMGKTTLLRTWSASLVSQGVTVLSGTCGPLDSSAPLDVVLAAIGEHLRRTGDHAEVLGDDAAVLMPLVLPGRTPARSATQLSDPVLGPETLYAALTAALTRIAGRSGVVLIVDDAHLAGPALADWLRFAARRPLPLLFVAAVRPAEGTPLPATDDVGLGPFDLAETAQLVGERRAGELHARSGGHPLFLAELAGAPRGELPPSLVDAVLRRCDQLGASADVVVTAAVLRGDLDVEVLSCLLSTPSLQVLAGIELAEGRGLLTEAAGRYTFRHELVREAIAAGVKPRRAALLHREAARILARRPDADPLTVAEHARLGGDSVLAARALRDAAERASARFDHEVAEALLDQSLVLDPDDDALLARARVRTRLSRYREAEADARSVTDAAAGAEVAAWAAYFDRRFGDTIRYAADGELASTDDSARARCLIVGGRTRHARGDLADAERQLRAAADLARGPDRLTAAAWLGVLMAHRSRVDEALDLLRPATHPGTGVDHTSAALHAVLFTGHAHALAGRPREALTAFDRYTREVERRQVPRFAGRGVNFGGWVLRNLGAADAAVDAHQQALEVADGTGTPELRVAALEDLAEHRINTGDPAAAVRLIDQARASLAGDLVFGWRLSMKVQLLQARVSLLLGHPEQCLAVAGSLRERASSDGVPRYASEAALLVHQARAALGEPIDLDRAWQDLAEVERSVRLEAWWWAGDTGVALGQHRWLVRAERLADDLASASGDHADRLRVEAGRRLADWSVRSLH